MSGVAKVDLGQTRPAIQLGLRRVAADCCAAKARETWRPRLLFRTTRARCRRIWLVRASESRPRKSGDQTRLSRSSRAPDVVLPGPPERSPAQWRASKPSPSWPATPSPPPLLSDEATPRLSCHREVVICPHRIAVAADSTDPVSWTGGQRWR